MVGNTLLTSRCEIGGCCAIDAKAIALSISNSKRFFLMLLCVFVGFIGDKSNENIGQTREKSVGFMLFWHIYSIFADGKDKERNRLWQDQSKKRPS